eukprot:3623850-Rhodomonas_salina.1
MGGRWVVGRRVPGGAIGGHNVRPDETLAAVQAENLAKGEGGSRKGGARENGYGNIEDGTVTKILKIVRGRLDLEGGSGGRGGR